MPKLTRHRSLLFIFLTIVFGVTVPRAGAQDENPTDSDQSPGQKKREMFFRAKVLPLLQSRCFECHNFSDDIRKTDELGGSLSLSSRKSMLKGGDNGPAIVPGSPDDSLLIQAIRYNGFEMPPRSKMPDAEIRILEKWIKDGAYFPSGLESTHTETAVDFPLAERAAEHWAWHFQPEKVIVPQAKNDDWSASDVDRFILQSLNEHDLDPAADADRPTLIRRLTYDLTGLPPTIQDIETFVSDSRSTEEAMAAVVDRLLASPDFGEHWGRHWLDLVRYADTLGHEFDYPLHDAWKYRDYVIRAFNADVRYDMFVKEHIAGDLLRWPRRNPSEKFNESIIGTGFWFLHEAKHAPVDVRAEEAAIIDNQIDVFSKTFLGMTLACARCHDHKFDAISTADYYAMAGFLQSSRRSIAWLDKNYEIDKQLRVISAKKQAVIRALDDAASEEQMLDSVSAYLSAAAEVMHKNVPSDVKILTDEQLTSQRDGSKQDARQVVFSDFEQPNFVDHNAKEWKAKGKAFEKGPTKGNGGKSQHLTNLQGAQTANSFAGSDKVTGTLTSPEFEIRHPAISFLICGGGPKESVGFHLLVDGEVVRSASGKRSDKLARHTWILNNLMGKKATLQVVDQAKGGWGHIVVDDIRFHGLESSLEFCRSIEEVALNHKLNRNILLKWLHLIQKADLNDMPAVLRDAASFVKHFQGDSLIDAYRHAEQRSLDESLAVGAKEGKWSILADFSDGVPEDFTTTGQLSFDQEADGWTLWEDDQPSYARGCFSSANLSVKQRGSLFSPSFTIRGDSICIEIAGVKSSIRLVVDGYVMHEFSPLLFKETKVDVNTAGKFQWIILKGDLGRYQGHRAHLEFRDDNDGWFAVRQIVMPVSGSVESVTSRTPDDNRLIHGRTYIRLLDLAVGSRKADLKESLRSFTHLYYGDKPAVLSWMISQGLTATRSESQANDAIVTQQAKKAIDSAISSWKAAAHQLPVADRVIAMIDSSPENERVFIRGNHKTLGDIAPRNILTALQTTSNSVKPASGSGRLQLAEKVVDPNNPLTSRVAVNRIWHHLFGRGIVASTDNFGVLGETPSHPKLLDFLAKRFAKDGWSVKSMIRTLVLSRTYRMASVSNPKCEQADPDNRWLHRSRIRRLPAEAIRDTMLSVAGVLSKEQFGPPVPIKLNSFMQGRGRPGKDGPLDGNGRRSIYLKINRNFLSPMMTAFDAPTPFTTIGRRNVSNVPAQSLILLNNSFVNDMANRWATQLDEQSETVEDAVAQAWYQLYGFTATKLELAPLLTYAKELSKSEPRQAVLNSIGHALLNGKQFLYLR